MHRLVGECQLPRAGVSVVNEDENLFHAQQEQFGHRLQCEFPWHFVADGVELSRFLLAVAVRRSRAAERKEVFVLMIFSFTMQRTSFRVTLLLQCSYIFVKGKDSGETFSTVSRGVPTDLVTVR